MGGGASTQKLSNLEVGDDETVTATNGPQSTLQLSATENFNETWQELCDRRKFLFDPTELETGTVDEEQIRLMIGSYKAMVGLGIRFRRFIEHYGKLLIQEVLLPPDVRVTQFSSDADSERPEWLPKPWKIQGVEFYIFDQAQYPTMDALMRLGKGEHGRRMQKLLMRKVQMLEEWERQAIKSATVQLRNARLLLHTGFSQFRLPLMGLMFHRGFYILAIASTPKDGLLDVGSISPDAIAARLESRLNIRNIDAKKLCRTAQDGRLYVSDTRYLFPSEHTTMEWRALRSHGLKDKKVDPAVELQRQEANLQKIKNAKGAQGKVDPADEAYVEKARLMLEAEEETVERRALVTQLRGEFIQRLTFQPRCHAAIANKKARRGIPEGTTTTTTANGVTIERINSGYTTTHGQPSSWSRVNFDHNDVDIVAHTLHHRVLPFKDGDGASCDMWCVGWRRKSDLPRLRQQRYACDACQLDGRHRHSDLPTLRTLWWMLRSPHERTWLQVFDVYAPCPWVMASTASTPFAALPKRPAKMMQACWS